MLPILLNLGIIKIYTFGVFLVLAFFWGMFFLWKNVQLTSFKEDDVFDAFFVSMFGGLFMARLFHVILNFDKFGFDVVKFILINGYPGLSFYGGLIGALLTLYLYLMSKKIKFSSISDYIISPLFLAIGIAKIGGFFSGAEIGTKTNFFVSLKYANFDGTRHLTSFYEALFFLFASFIAYRLLFSVRRQRYPNGFVFLFFIWATSLILLAFDPLKANRTYIFGTYSFNFYLSLILCLTLTVYIGYYLRADIQNGILFILRSLKINGKRQK